MKIEWNKKYNSIAVYSTVVGCLIVLMTFIAINLTGLRDALNGLMTVLNPIIIGLIIAYLLNPLMKFYKKRLFGFVEKKKPHPKLRRGFAITLAYITLAVILAIFFVFLLPQVVTSYNDLSSKATDYIGKAVEWAEDLIGSKGFVQEQLDRLLEYLNYDRLGEWLTSSLDVILGSTSAILSSVTQFVGQLFNIFLGLIISIYVLASSETLYAQLSKLSSAIFKPETKEKIYSVIRKTDHTFGGFIIGKIIDSLIIGVLTFIVLAIFNMPFYPLVSLIVCVTNVIPFFGPFIGAIPSAFIIFVASPVKAFWFLIIILIIQQLDGNFIGPKILGDKLGLSALGVIIAIIVMSGLLGVTGMFIGVPVFALLYTFVKEAVEKQLRKKRLPTATDEYVGKMPESAPAENTENRSDAPEGGDDHEV